MSYKYKTFSASWEKLAKAQKRKDVALPYTLYINRPLGRFLAVIGHKLKLSPDFISLLSITFTIIGLVYLLVVPTSWIAVISSIFLLLLGFGLDSADGQLARLTGLKSPAGEWLDHALDSIKIPLFHATIVAIIFQSKDLHYVELLMLLSVGAFASARFFSTEIKEKILNSSNLGNPGLGLWRDIILSPFDYGVLCFIFLFVPGGYLYEAYAIWGIIFVTYAILSLIRSYHQLKQI